jgi:peroxiredoxin
LAGLRTLLNPKEQVSIVGVSPDPVAQNKLLAEKTLNPDGFGAFPGLLLADAQSRVIDAWGVKDARYSKIKLQGIPQPAIFLINKSGRVAWARLGSHVPNKDIRAAIDALR